MEEINSNFNKININNDIYYNNLVDRCNWNFNKFIQEISKVDEEYKTLYKMKINDEINKLIEFYMKIDVHKRGYKEKFLLMIQIDDELSDIWN